MLGDYRILDCTDARGALCGQLLADLGADVLRVEPPGGSPMREGVAWELYARNCRAITLDTEADEGAARFAALAAQADAVLAHGDAVGGVRFEALRARLPRLVWVSITPFGASGPKAGYAATDLIVQAAGGAMAITGFADDRPLRTGAIPAWSHAGAAAAGAALLALRQREHTGTGRYVDVSAQLSVNLSAAYTLLTPYIDATRARRAGAPAGAAVPYVWPARDGFVSLTLGFLGPMLGFARNLLAWMHEDGAIDAALASLDWPDYIGAMARGERTRAEFDALLEGIGRFLLGHTKQALLDGALRRGVLIVPVSTTHELLASPQLQARGFWWDVDGARQAGAFARFGAWPLRLRSPAPTLAGANATAAADPQSAFLPRAAVPDAAPDAARDAVSATAMSPAATQARASGALPLAGVKVLDFSWVMAGPWCTRVLADYGATVVKVESRTRMDLVRVLGPFYGDRVTPETSASFAGINAGKLSIELDPNTAEGKATILDLVDWADIVLESFSPRAMAKWGLDYPALRARKPPLVMLSTCLFGQTGPLSGMAGYGTMGAALGGLVLPTGVAGRPPCGPFGPYTDFVAPRFSIVALLAALHHRDRTGEGQYIDQSQAESAMHAMSLALLESARGAPAPDRLGNTDAAMFPHDAYPCAGDDQWVAMAVRHDADWRALTAELGRADWAALDLQARRDAQPAIDDAIAAWTRAQSAPEAERRLQRAGVPAHAVLNGALSKDDAQLAHRGHFLKTTHAVLGEVFVESTGYVIDDVVPRVGRVPSLGGDGDAVQALLRAWRGPAS